MNEKGFTMIELLATITILGILMAVAIGAISWILDLNEKRYYSTLEKNVVLAAKSYYADNRASLPQAIGQSKKVTLKTLVEKKYLAEVLDYGKGDCTKSSNSYVKVTKYSSKDYLYAAYFECPAYKTSEEDRIKDISITINFDFDSKKIADSVANIKITSTDENKIASFEYSILKDGQYIYSSDNISAGYVDSLNRKVKLKKYVPGNIRVVVTAYDIYGNRKTVAKEVAIYNEGVPECGTHTPVYDSWTNVFLAKRKVTVKCVSGDVGCLRSRFSETFQDDMEIGYITIIGTNNKERKCPVGVYIDTTDPECGNNTGSTNWTKSNRTVKVNCTDATSGCKKDVYEKTFSTTTTTANIEIEDKAGNKKTCPVNVYVDKTQPTCGSFSGNVIDGKATNATVTVGCSDSQSGCAQSTYSTTVPASTKKVDITIADRAGNQRTCSTNITVRVTKPSIPTATIREDNANGKVHTNSNSWTSKTLWWGDFRVADDGGDSIDHYEYSEGCTGKSSGNLSSSYTYSSNKNTSYCIRAVNSSNLYSDWSDPYYFKIDKTAPTISVKIYKRNDAGNKTGKPIAQKSVTGTTVNVNKGDYSTSDTYHGWLNAKKFPNGVVYEISYSDNYELSGKARLWNEGNEELNYDNYVLQKITGTSGSATEVARGEGRRILRYTIKDAAGNLSNLFIYAYIDRTPPDYIHWLAESSRKIYTCGGRTKNRYETRFTFVDEVSEHNCASFVWYVNGVEHKQSVCAGRNRQYQTEGLCHDTYKSTDTFTANIIDNAGNKTTFSDGLHDNYMSTNFKTTYRNFFGFNFHTCDAVTVNKKNCGF